MIAKEMRKELSLTGKGIFSGPREDISALGITECSRDDRWLRDSITLVDNEPTDFINKSNITWKSVFLESPQDLTQVYGSPSKHYFLADAKKLEAFIMFVRQKLDERDLTIRELQFEIEKMNKKRRFSSSGFRLPKDYYENDAYIVE